MGDAMVNISACEDSFEIAQDLLNFSSNDQGEVIFKWIEKLSQIVHTLTNRCRGLANSLDAANAQHAEEMDVVKHAYEAKLNEMKDQINGHLTSLNNLNIENRTKTAECERFTDVLRSIKEQIDDLIVPVECEDEQSEDDSVPSEQGNNADGDGENADNDDEIQRDAEIGQSNDDILIGAPTQDQDDADQGQDDDVQMTAADNREYIFGAQNDKENVQPPQNAVALPSSAPLQPAPIDQPLVDNSNTNQANKCFKCVETFVQESALFDHLSHFHGMLVVTKSNGENEPNNEPGQFVRNPAKKRKTKTPLEDIAIDENANNRNTGRKIKKTPSASAN